MEFGQNIDAKYEKSRAKLKDSLVKLGGLESISMATVGKIRKDAIESSLPYKTLVSEFEDSDVPKTMIEKYCKKEFKELKNAYSWARENYSEDLSETFLENLNKKYANKMDSDEVGFRDNDLELIGSDYKPIEPEKIASEVKSYVSRVSDKLKSNELINVVDASIDAHFNMLRLRPFYDANNRTSKTVQNLILDNRGVPLPIISESDKSEYYDLMNKAFVGHNSSSEELSSEEKMFYSYMMDKVNDSVGEVIEASK